MSLIKQYCLAVCLFFVSYAASALDFSQLNSEPDFLPVEQAFQFDFNQQGDLLTLSWKIADDYYLYKHSTKAKIESSELPIKFVQTGKKKHDEYFGEVMVFYQNLEVTVDVSDINDDNLLITYQGCAEAGLCYPPQLIKVPLLKPTAAVNQQSEPSAADTTTPDISNSGSDIENLFNNKSQWLVILGFFILGIGLSLTPCVLPMVPILSAIVTGQQHSNAKKGLILSIAYVFGMASFYTLSGVLVGYFGASFNLQLYLQTPAVVLVFTAIFIALAFAMFGYYELALPANLQSKLQGSTDGQNKKGLFATYVMGGISALALSPCVSAPLASALLYISTTGDGLLGGLALFTLSIGMGLPLLAVGAGFSGLVPKAGGWMTKVKQLFGIMMLAMAVWMLERLFPPIWGAALWAALGVWTAIQLNLFTGLSDNTANLTGRKNEKAFAIILFIASLGWLGHVYLQTFMPFQNANNQQQVEPQLVKRIDSVAELAQQMANVSDKKVVVDLYADWCASCQVIEHEVFAKVSAADYPEYEFLQLDLTDMTEAKQAFLNQHQLFGPPALLIFEAGEQPRQTAFVYQAEFNLAQFKQWLN